MNFTILSLFLCAQIILTLGRDSLCSFNRKCECFEIGRRLYVKCEHLSSLNYLQDLFSENRFARSVSVFTVKKCEAQSFPSIFSNVAIEEIRSNCPIKEIEGGALSSIESLRVLNLHLTKFQKIPKAISKLKSLKVLTINEGKLTGIDAELQDLSNLIKLQLTRNDIRQVSYEAFPWNPKIKVIDLSHNKLVFLYPGIFDNCQELMKISLRGNYLSSVDGLFTVPSLQEVSIRENNIESLDDAFHHESHLEILDAGKNPLYEISVSAFDSKLRNMRTLILDNCELSFLPFTLFKSLTKLEIIDLSFNKLESIPSELFHDQNNLLKVNLRNNRLTELGEIFIRNPRLETVILSSNHLQTCEDIFYGPYNLKNVDLRDNEIKSLTGECFSDVRFLTKLLLSKNRIYRIHTNAFVNLKHLNHLSLDHNKLAYLNGCLRNMSELEVLLLNHNALSEIKEHEFQNLPKLKRLNLGNNRISAVSRAFRRLNSLQSLTISKNKLTTLTRSAFPAYFTVKEIFLSGNKWVCDCRLLWILKLKTVTDLANRIKCFAPQRFFKETLSQLTPLDLMTWDEDCE